MAAHARFSVDRPACPVYFCDPRSPWQRGSNENTNGLLRQYFPKRTEIAHFTQADLDDVAAELNGQASTNPRMEDHHHKHSTKRCDEPLNSQPIRPAYAKGLSGTLCNGVI